MQAEKMRREVTCFLKNLPKIISTLLFTFCSFVLIVALIVNQDLPSHYYVSPGTKLEFAEKSQITASRNKLSKKASVNSATPVSDRDYTVNLNLFGMIPIKTASVKVSNTRYVIAGGQPFGIKLFTDGVMVVSTGSVQTEQGIVNPAKQHGIKAGDIIVAVNNKTVSSNKDLSDIIKKSKGKSLSLTLKRDSRSFCIDFTPVKSIDGDFKGGLWVRDSTAGIGTMTFVDPENGTFGGLGHAVCDVDTGDVLPLLTGEIFPTEITGVKQSQSGAPGELTGHFSGNSPIGALKINGSNGVYGVYYDVDKKANTIPVATVQQVKKGSATVLSCASGHVKEYTCEIEKVSLVSDGGLQNMIVRITDKELLNLTGGIVQGMSGSPIIQNGMLVGALTHVFVDDPQRGYGTFAQMMLETSSTITNEVMKKAS